MGFFNLFKKKKDKKESEEVIDELSTDEEQNQEDTTQDEITETTEKETIQDEIAEATEKETIQDEIAEATEKETIQDEKAKATATEKETSEEEIIVEEDVMQQEVTQEENEKEEDEKVAEDETKVVNEKSGFIQKIISGLDETRKNIMSGIENVLKSFTKIDEELYEELEEALIMADIGVNTSLEIIEQLRNKVKEEKINEPEKLRSALIQIITDILTDDEQDWKMESPTILLVIGVNGVGKTTTIGKLMNIYKNDGHNVLVAAADTFRAAAIDQLEVWGKRSDIDVISQQEGADPAAVVFDAVKAAKARNTDILIVDTAGRLHNKKNLMDELGKISRVIEREYPEAKKEVFLVLDATTGQNAMQQAKVFKETADLTGLALTKLDGTAKGGVIIAIKNELKIPVRYIGVGEQIDDLQQFVAEDFAKALFNE